MEKQYRFNGKTIQIQRKNNTDPTEKQYRFNGKTIQIQRKNNTDSTEKQYRSNVKTIQNQRKNNTDSTKKQYRFNGKTIQIQRKNNTDSKSIHKSTLNSKIKAVISVTIKDFIHHYPRVHFYNIPRSSCSFTTYPGRDALLQHTQVGMQFYNIPRSGCSFTTFPGRDALLQHTQVGMQFHNIPTTLESYILSVYSPFSDRVVLPLPGGLMKGIGAAFFDRMPFLTSTTCVRCNMCYVFNVNVTDSFDDRHNILNAV